jgi:hypothetical protein
VPWCFGPEKPVLTGGRFAFFCEDSGDEAVYETVLVFDRGARRPFEAAETEGGFSALEGRATRIGGLAGSGGRLFFDTFAERFKFPHERFFRRRLWALHGRRRVPIGSAGSVVDADASRVLVETPARALAVLRSDGALVRRFPLRVPPAPTISDLFGYQPPPARLDGARVVVQLARRLLVYDADSGRREAAWPLPRAARLEDAYSGLAAYVARGRVHLFDLATGHDSVVAAPSRLLTRSPLDRTPIAIHAALGNRGLVYAYNVRARRYRGRVVFVAVRTSS